MHVVDGYHALLRVCLSRHTEAMKRMTLPRYPKDDGRRLPAPVVQYPPIPVFVNSKESFLELQLAQNRKSTKA